MMIDKELLQELSCQSAGDEMDGWVVLSNEVDGTWRWGTEHTLILRAIGSEEIYGYYYRHSSGDGDYSSFDDEGEEVELMLMQAVQKTAYEPVK
jgi:hypothetical protein